MADAFQSLLDVLGKSARQAYNYVRGAINDKVPVSAALSGYRNIGGKIATQTFTDLYAALASRADVDRYLRLIGEDQPLPLTAHNLSNTDLEPGTNFQYLVGTNSRNPLIPEAIYVNSPTPLSANDIYAKAAQAFHYEEVTGMSPGQLQDVVFTIDDARYLPEEGPPPPVGTTEEIARALDFQQRYGTEEQPGIKKFLGY